MTQPVREHPDEIQWLDLCVSYRILLPCREMLCTGAPFFCLHPRAADGIMLASNGALAVFRGAEVCGAGGPGPHRRKDTNMTNIWHDISPSRINPEDFIAVIEIEKG